MTTSSIDGLGAAHQRLQDIALIHGPDAIDDQSLIARIFGDLGRQHPREVAAVIAAAQLQVGARLKSRVATIPAYAAVTEVTRELSDATAIDVEAARWVVTAYAIVLGLIPAPPAAPPMSAPGGARWSVTSQPGSPPPGSPPPAESSGAPAHFDSAPAPWPVAPSAPYSPPPPRAQPGGAPGSAMPPLLGGTPTPRRSPAASAPAAPTAPAPVATAPAPPASAIPPGGGGLGSPPPQAPRLPVAVGEDPAASAEPSSKPDKSRSRGGAKSAVERAVARSLRKGLLTFTTPDSMRQGGKERVEVGIARTADLESELDGLFRTTAPRVTEVIETAEYMTVELIGDAFTIVPLSRPNQLVVPLARWEFDVTPKQAGNHTLTIVGTCWITVGADQREVSLPSFERQIRVSVDVVFGFRRALSANWQWIVGTVAGLGAAIAGWVALFK